MFELVKPSTSMLGKGTPAYLALKTAIQAAYTGLGEGQTLSSDDLAVQLKAALPSGWQAADISEGVLKQAVQDLDLPHRMKEPVFIAPPVKLIIPQPEKETEAPLL